MFVCGIAGDQRDAVHAWFIRVVDVTCCSMSEPIDNSESDAASDPPFATTSAQTYSNEVNRRASVFVGESDDISTIRLRERRFRIVMGTLMGGVICVVALVLDKVSFG